MFERARERMLSAAKAFGPAAVEMAAALRELEATGEYRLDLEPSAEAWAVEYAEMPAYWMRLLLRMGRQLELAPQTRAEGLSGALALGKVQAICAQVTQAWAPVEAEFLTRLRGLGVRRVGREMRAWRRSVAEPVRADRAFHLVHDRDTGGFRLGGVLDGVGGQALRAALEAISKELPDTGQSPAELRADALVELAHAYLGGQRAGSGDARPHLSVVIDWKQMHADDPTATFLDGSAVPAWETLALLCDCEMHAMVIGQEPEQLFYGRSRRTATDAQRQVLAARWQGCAMCGGASWRCDAHHVPAWDEGGWTDVDKMVWLCRHCHRQLHRFRWRCEIRADGAFVVTNHEGVTRTYRPPGSGRVAA